MDEKIEIEQGKLELEKHKVELDDKFRQRELDIKELERQDEHVGGFRITAAQATIIVAAIGIISGALGAGINGYFQREVGGITVRGDKDVEEIRAQAQIDLERQKFESSLILKAIEQSDVDESIKTLRFFANAGLIPSHKEDVLKLATDANREAIPSFNREKRACIFTEHAVSYGLASSIPEVDAKKLMPLLDNIYSQWGRASGIIFSTAATGIIPDIIINYSDKENEYNHIASTYMPCDGHNSRIDLSTKFDWKIASSSINASKDAQFAFTSLLHEAGHSLGINHSLNPDAVMFPVPQVNMTLSSVDISAIQKLYPQKK